MYHKIKIHNAKYDAGLVSYALGINHLTDLTSRETKRMLNGLATTNK